MALPMHFKLPEIICISLTKIPETEVPRLALGAFVAEESFELLGFGDVREGDWSGVMVEAGGHWALGQG